MKFDQPLPPGTILQFMYLKERLRKMQKGRFLEIGCGHGLITQILLDAGWSGIAYDLNDESLEKARERNEKAVRECRLTLKHMDWLQETSPQSVDLVISSLVLEHMDDSSEKAYIEKCKLSLNSGGKAILFVPHSPTHWGIEDEIAGHYRRYTKESLSARFNSTEWTCSHTAALTYPLSNWLLPLGNRLVMGSEKNKLKESMLDRTKLSGNRNVPFKTSFPTFLGLVLNELTMLPFHLMQKANSEREDALLLYVEYSSLPAPSSQRATPVLSSTDGKA